MATLVQILIVAILSFIGMNPDTQEKMADKERTVIEAAFQTQNFVFTAEKIEHQKWEFISTEQVVVTLAE